MYLVDEPPVDECEILMQQIGELNSKMKLYCAAKAKMALVGDYLELE